MTTISCHLPFTPQQGLNHGVSLPAAADLQPPGKEFRVEIQNKALCVLGETGRTGQEEDFMTLNFLASPCI